MSFLMLASAVASVGAIIGWFCRGRLGRALVVSAALSLVFLGAALLYGGEPQSVELRSLATLPFYWVVPYVLFFLIPCTTAASITTFFYRRITQQ